MHSCEREAQTVNRGSLALERWQLYRGMHFWSFVGLAFLAMSPPSFLRIHVGEVNVKGFFLLNYYYSLTVLEICQALISHES